MASSESKSEWSCPKCTFINPGDANKCTICGTDKPITILSDELQQINKLIKFNKYDARKDILSDLEGKTDGESQEKRLIYHNEQHYRQTSEDNNLNNTVREFKSRGGKVYFMPSLDNVEIHEKNTIIKDDSINEIFTIKKDDILYPVCHQGVNRSQVLYLLLKSFKLHVNGHITEVIAPHGAESGFDPYKLSNPLTYDNYFQYLNDVVIQNDPTDILTPIFNKTFGHDKHLRYGTDYVELKKRERGEFDLNIKHNGTHDFEILYNNRKHMRDWFKKDYYNSTFSTSRRRVFITFMRSSKIIMDRLMESETPLDNIVIISFPWGDTIGNACSLDKINNNLGRASDASSTLHESEFDSDHRSMRTFLCGEAYRNLYVNLSKFFTTEKNDSVVEGRGGVGTRWAVAAGTTGAGTGAGAGAGAGTVGGGNNEYYKQKYLKYKSKYLNLQNKLN